MIIFHPLKLIFVKTKKVGGTSFEIALSRYCGPDCIITPISTGDEATRHDLGFRGAQNHRMEGRVGAGVEGHPNAHIRGNFRNHKPAEAIHRQIGDEMYRAYTKVSIYRDPVDFIVSLYFYEMRDKEQTRKPFREWFFENRGEVLENAQIAPLNGPHACDVIFQYEALNKQISESAVLPHDFLDTFASINSKGNYRDSASRDAIGFFVENGLEAEIDGLASSPA